MSLESTIGIIANVALALSLVVGLVFGIVQTRASSRDRRERLTLEAMRMFQSREFAELIYTVRTMNTPQTREEFEAMPGEVQIIFIEFTQQMEGLGMMVYEHFIDLDLVDKTLGSYVSTSWEQYKALVQDLRVKMNDPFLSEYYQWLAERIADRMENHPREPYYVTNAHCRK